MRVIWKFFCSRKLALVLIAVIVVVSIIGTVIPQKASPNVYIERFGEGWFRFFRATGIINLYHSWWFNLLFVLISINIIVCSIDRLRKILHFLRKRTVVVEEKTISGMRNFESFESVSDIEEIRRIFKKNNYRIRTQDSGKLRYMMAEKGIISRFGSTITHFSILIIFFGGSNRFVERF